MQKFNSVLNLFYLICLISLFVFHGFLLSENNALPFFYKDYPTYENNGKKNFDMASESLVLNRIDFAVLDIEYKHRFHLWRAGNEKAQDGESFEKEEADISNKKINLLNGYPYQSQIGLHSWFWSFMAKGFGVEYGNYRLIKLMSVLLFSFSLAFVLVWIKIEFGNIAGYSALFFSVFSTGFALFSSSLYWAAFLFILPIAAVCVLSILKVERVWVIFLVVTPFLFMKFLAGYEFITVLGLAMAFPYIFNFINFSEKAALKKDVVLVLASALAFVGSLLLYDKLFRLDFSGSGFEHIFGRSESWSLSSFGEKGLNPISQVVKISIMNFMDVNGFGIPLLAFLGLIVGILIYTRNIITKRDYLGMFYVLFGSLSWFIVQTGHMLFHPRFAIFVLAFPFGLFITAYTSRLLETYLQSKKMKWEKPV